MKNRKENIFLGLEAYLDFLDPDNAMPLVQLPKGVSEDLDGLLDDGVEAFAKLYNNPNIKLLPAINMMDDAKRSGRLEGVHTIVEASSGNMVYALNLIKGRYGIKTILPIIPWDVAPGTHEVLRLMGVEFQHHHGNGISLARELGKQSGWLNLDQYSNPANPEAHEKWTGPHIFEQMAGDIAVIAAGLGTTASMEGLGRFLKGKLGTKITTVGVLIKEPTDPEEKAQGIPGVRTEAGLKDIKFDWKKWSDSIQKVGASMAYKYSFAMMKFGIPAGPSSGFALCGLIKFLLAERANGNLDKHRNGNGIVRTVFICPDAPDKYLDKYSTILSLGDFKPAQ